jgi:hypothetical protein
MRRIAQMLFAAAALTGGAFTAQLWIVSAKPSPGFLGALQIGDLAMSEPAGIVLASALLFGSTTLLRRRRAHRQALSRIQKPAWQILPGSGGNIKEAV